MIVDGSVQLGNGTTAQIAAATTVIPLLGQIVLNTQTGQYKIGDGVTALSALTYYGGSSGLTVGTSTITSGTNTRILYNNNGVLGEYAVTGTGTTAVLSTSPTFTTDITTPQINGVTSLIALTTNTIHATTGSFCAGRSNPDRPIEVYSSTGIATMQAYTTKTDSYAGVYSQADNLAAYAGLVMNGSAYVTNGLLLANSAYYVAAGTTVNVINANVAGDVVIATGGYATSNEKLRFSPTITKFINSTFQVGNPTGTGLVTLRDMSGVGSTSNAIYFGTAAPSTTNHILAWDTSSTYINVPGANSVYIQSAGTNNMRIGATFCIFTDGVNLRAGTTTGSKIGISTSEKWSFWNATPIVQPTTAVAAATFVANTSGIVNDSATFDGYTIGQVVKALRNTGLLA